MLAENEKMCDWSEQYFESSINVTEEKPAVITNWPGSRWNIFEKVMGIIWAKLDEIRDFLQKNGLILLVDPHKQG